ncbi:MAG: dihydrofolate reductase family protein [Polyangiaceae bacterium]
MRKLTLIMTASIDGYVSAPTGKAIGAHPEPAELKRWKLDRIRRAGTHIMGRKTYQEMASFWPTATDDYAAPMNEIPKVVFSRTLKEASWPESSIASGDLADEIAALKKQPGGEIIAWGGASFAQSLSKARVVDQYAVITRPLAYGGGKPLFLDLPDALQFEVLATMAFPDGMALRIYQPT